MKKVLILNGSPRRNGNTNWMVEKLNSLFNKNYFETEILFLYDYDINACTDCRICKSGAMKCNIKDGMQEIYPKIEEADILIIGTPIYWFSLSAMTKLLLDRFRPFFGNKKLNAKKIALLLPAGTGATDCDLTIEIFKRSARALGMEYIASATSKAYDIGDAKNDKKSNKEITELSAKIQKLLSCTAVDK